MTAEIVDLATRRPGDPNVRIGNGAREALIELALTFNNTGQDDAERWTDFILAELWARGFKAVPVE